MYYREDLDLKFLKEMSSGDLQDLHDLVMYDKDGSERLGQMLSISEYYKKHHPNHNKYWDLIAAEVQCYGGNSFANMMRGGKGVCYDEILDDVIGTLKVPSSMIESGSAKDRESAVFLFLLEKAMSKMSEAEIRELAAEMDLKDVTGAKILTARAALSAFRYIFKAGGFKSYQLTVIIANAVMKQLFGRGLSLAANATLTKSMSVLMGPIGWVIAGVWAAIDIAGPATRVTIPAVIQIGMLRQKYMND